MAGELTLRGEQATDIYKRLLLENRVDLALNVYVAMCYYKLDYYDVSLEILGVFFQSHRDSPVAINLKVCGGGHIGGCEAARPTLTAHVGRRAITSGCTTAKQPRRSCAC